MKTKAKSKKPQNAESVDDEFSRICAEQLQRRKELLSQANRNEANINMGINDFEFRQRLREGKERQSNQSQYLFNDALIAQDYNEYLEKIKKRSSRIHSHQLAMANILEQNEIINIDHCYLGHCVWSFILLNMRK